jgi:hypothetical protein
LLHDRLQQPPVVGGVEEQPTGDSSTMALTYSYVAWSPAEETDSWILLLASEKD